MQAIKEPRGLIVGAGRAGTVLQRKAFQTAGAAIVGYVIAPPKLIHIPLALLAAALLGGIWAAIPTADLASSIWTGIWLSLELRHLRRRHVVEDEADLAAPAKLS